jgi:Spy/CpxP family protein refolding chaperone
MKLLRFIVVVAVFSAVTAGTTIGQDKGKAKGQLPQGWAKLGLSDEQKTKIYEVQAKHRAKIEELEKQIKAVREQMYKDQVDVLTDAQKARLKEIFNEKLGETPSNEKKK